MPGPYPLPTLAVTIDQSGITAPTFEDIVASLQASYRQIYGSDVDLDADTQDGQWIGVHARAIYDTNQALIAGYLAYSPATAQGTGLSSVVKINGLKRLSPSNSTAPLLIVGQAGTIIRGGVVADLFQNSWSLPQQVVIPPEGQILVTAICQTPGSVLAAPDTITDIVTMQPGWQTATNPQSAFPGLPVETDATLRKRQSFSTSLPAITPRESIAAAVANVAAVGRTFVHENDSDRYDVDLVPPHTIAVVVEGGDAMQIAQAIAIKKNTGCGTYGTTRQVVFDSHGVPLPVDFFYLIEMPIFVTVRLQPLPGYLETTGALITATIAAYIENFGIGEDVYASRLAAPANLAGDEAMAISGMSQPQLDILSATYVVRAILIGLAAEPLTSDDVVIPFNAAASCNISNVTVIVSTVH